MTRKQALLQAISILSKNKDCNDITEKLIEIESEMPLCHWTKASIIDRIITYAEENNNMLPFVSDLTKENNMPSTTAISHNFNIGSMESFFKEYFPQYRIPNKRYKSNSPYKNMDIKAFMKIFSSNYDRISEEYNVDYVDTKMYDKHKDINSPSLITIIKNCNCKTYKELLILCGYKKELELKCHINRLKIDDEHSNKELRKTINEIIKELKNET